MKSPVNAIDRLARSFAEDGHSLYLVGGSVRDQLLGHPVHDYDFTTDAGQLTNRFHDSDDTNDPPPAASLVTKRS